ncbi:uncharacterized protein LOC110427297 [Herrania umbratica]|uniref:Uncharacterized protein LOC110427297 n=1 Tax=Herrania umbratica TaxID=108875 RepID=A0A6J1BG19_9ROSI|nr:uncharacterized protein LOC110427297 [Herrania umbratica]
MSEEEWVKEAMTNDMLVAEVIMSLAQAEPPPPPPPPNQSAKNNCGSLTLQLEWSVHQRRSKQALRKKSEPARASPTTPLSWSSGTSVSGGGGVDDSEGSSRPSLKPVDNARSKVSATNETTPPKRSRRKKTLPELKEEMSSHLEEHKSLKNELDIVKLKFENLRAINETLSRKLKFEKEQATNKSSKRIKLEYQSHQPTKTTMAFPEPENTISELSPQREVAFQPSSVGCNEREVSVQDVVSCEASFMLPDLNLPIGDD